MQIRQPDYSWNGSLTPRQRTENIILHHAAADNVTAELIHGWHLSLNWRGIAYHYFVGKDGSIAYGRPENMQGGHTTGENDDSIGICFEGNFENEQMPDAQLEAGRWLIADIKTRYNVPVKKHKDFNNTACPGQYFPFVAITTPPVIVDPNIPDEWATKSWEKYRDLGILDGTRPLDDNTRQELAVALDRFENYIMSLVANIYIKGEE